MPNSTRLTLEIMIATYGPDGGRKAAKMLLPPTEGIKYLVSWQSPKPKAMSPDDVEIPDELAAREDVKVVTLSGKGLARNRNNCLKHATGDLLLVGDDDIVLYPDGLQQAIAVFEANPELEYGSFRYDSDFPKQYPSAEMPLKKLPKNFYQTTFEIVLRRDSRAGRLRFPENFGLNAPEFGAGEEDLLLLRARRHGLDCRFFPITTCCHPGRTTGVESSIPDDVLRAFGACMAAEYPVSCVLRIPLKSWRLRRGGQAKFFHSLRLMGYGACRALFGDVVRPYLTAPV